MKEKLYHESSVFLTLTWERDPFSLDHRPFQLFMKRLRKAREVLHVDVEQWASGARKFKYVTRPQIQYFMCGEYGENFARPHYHAIVFGVEFPDMKVYKTSPMTLYRSAELERLWPFGFSSIGEVTAESAQYVAGYVTSVVTGEAADDHYWKLNSETGELSQVTPEYGRMSLKNPIGKRYFADFHEEVTVRDGVVVGGKVMKPPRYFDRQLKGYASIDKKRGTARVNRAIDREKFNELQMQRLEMADAMAKDSTPERLRTAEAVVRSRLSLKRRLLEK